ncbi:MAG: hypothetical protein HWD90_12155 [Campylobacteraceae bacterium]|nr:hypothetical protein [Campylobacteraceae bacterium]
MKKELIYICLIFVSLSLIIHYKEFFSFPITHIKNLENAGAYGLGFLHPFIFTILVYLMVLIVRIVVNIFKRIINR